ncbi:MAG: hypothetical protein IPP64_08715 [Bacteroidetes bacterium]|nr:hypothetical protein [Bacteroidota bacterium]
MKKIIGIALVAFGALGMNAQNDVELKLTLRDGNVVSGTSKIASVSLTTAYGKLEVPIKNVTALDLGIVSDKATTDKVGNLIKQLSNSNEQMRKTAYDELVKMDIKAIPAISDFIYSSKYEPSTYTDYTADAAIGELQSKFNVLDNISDKDVVSIDYEYSMGGIYEFAKIDLKTEYGTLSIPKEKIKHIDVMYTGDSGSGDMTFKLLATKHISSNTSGGFLKTGIMLKQGQKFSITASGEVTFASLSGSKYKPDGSIAGTTTAPIADYEGDYGSGSTYPAYGNVVYKIGETSTQVLKAGAKFNGVAATSGMLYISIYETVYNASNTGSYTVKISLK